MASGKTLQMRAIRRPRPCWVHQHTAPTTAMRRAGVLINVDGQLVPARLLPGRCTPYVNPSRAHRMGRKNKPPQGKPQNPKAPKGGSKGGRKPK